MQVRINGRMCQESFASETSARQFRKLVDKVGGKRLNVCSRRGRTRTRTCRRRRSSPLGILKPKAKPAKPASLAHRRPAVRIHSHRTCRIRHRLRGLRPTVRGSNQGRLPGVLARLARRGCRRRHCSHGSDLESNGDPRSERLSHPALQARDCTVR